MFSWLWGASASSSASPAVDDAVAQLQATIADASHTFRQGAMGLKTYALPAFACFPPTHSPLSLMCLADCHARFPDIVCTPPCDVLVVAGDFTLTGSETEVQQRDALQARHCQWHLTRSCRCCSSTPGPQLASGATVCWSRDSAS